jgi:hypothetical protein
VYLDQPLAVGSVKFCDWPHLGESDDISIKI